MIYKSTKALLASVFALVTFFVMGCGSAVDSTKSQSAQWLNLDTVKAGKFDTGKMWTFDFPPKEYFKSEYNFSLDDEWLNNVRMSSLRFANYCSASFVSEDGLVMTNDHCARESVGKVNKEGEKALPVALSGRVPVKVSTANGPISAGDYLTTSETPGVAMKATHPGAIIGTAMTSFEGEGIGQILVFVKNGFFIMDVTAPNIM